MSTVDDGVWTCPDCHETVRGPARVRVAAQRIHGDDHGRDRRVQAARLAQDAEDRAEEKAARRRAAHARKQAKRGRGAR